jgi:hypothetical protein
LQETPLYVRVAFSQIQSMKNAKKNQQSEPTKGAPHA